MNTSQPRDQIDSRIEIVTPENIGFAYRVAGPFRRVPAFLIDLLMRGLIFAAGMVLSWIIFATIGFPGLGLGATLIWWFFVDWFYGGVFETYWNGQTPGKRSMHIRVLTIDGQPISGLQAVLRNVLRAVDAQPGVFCLFVLLTASMNDRYQRLGDLACGTMVVEEEAKRSAGIFRIDDPRAIALASEIPVTFETDRPLGQALSGYVQRRHMFSDARRVEIARHLANTLMRRFELLPDTDPDLLLCALYYRTFITDRADATGRGAVAADPMPAFLEPPNQFASFGSPSTGRVGSGRSPAQGGPVPVEIVE